MARATTRPRLFRRPDPVRGWLTIFGRFVRGAKGPAGGLALGLPLALALSACQITAPTPSSLKPQARPLAPPAAAPVASGPSAASESLRAYYTAYQRELLTQGLLRQDGGGPDTPYSAQDLARNFERIVFYDEYARGGGLGKSSGLPGRLRRWPGAVRISAEFGPSVSDAVKSKDMATIRHYTGRLARATGHPIAYADTGANFHVLVMGEDDRAYAINRIKQIVPDISGSSLGIFRNLPRSIHCLVVAFSANGRAHSYNQAVAFVRAEHPDLVRKSCYHEEMAQGLGLANDSPHARPSIFNDDDEFAFLTTHDEMLLGMLYSPRLYPGISLAEARPIITDLARLKAGGGS